MLTGVELVANASASAANFAHAANAAHAAHAADRAGSNPKNRRCGKTGKNVGLKFFFETPKMFRFRLWECFVTLHSPLPSNSAPDDF